MTNLNHNDLLIIKRSLLVTVSHYRDSIEKRNAIIENSYRMDTDEVTLYKNANKITQGWIDETNDTVAKINKML